ncbi:MAG: SGNH/GDSL hydrolase family protein [Burkholderiaceae bacterium]|nr:SGNH/GDSL hydrolase family protein [Burkholderiaceae bacterium]
MPSSLLAGLSILMVGDSHLTTSNYLIASLHENLVRQGASVHSLGVCGANAADWLVATKGTCGGAERKNGGKINILGPSASTVPIKTLIGQDKPDLVLVIMGDTMAGYKNPDLPKSWIWQQVTGLTKEIASTKTACVWVGPAFAPEGGRYGKTFARVQQMSSFLATSVAPCAYIDSLKFTTAATAWPTTDGQHYQPGGYRQWSDAIYKALIELPVVKGLKR